jgi:hypothetical protein
MASAPSLRGRRELEGHEKMDLHRTYAARFGISAAELEREPVWPTTRAHTRMRYGGAARLYLK